VCQRGGRIGRKSRGVRRTNSEVLGELGRLVDMTGSGWDMLVFDRSVVEQDYCEENVGMV